MGPYDDPDNEQDFELDDTDECEYCGLSYDDCDCKETDDWLTQWGEANR